MTLGIPNAKQYFIIMKIREKLEKYEEALLRQRRLNEISSPDDFDIEQIKSYNVSGAVRHDTIDNCNPLYGKPDGPFAEAGATDLIPLKSREYNDLFTWSFCEQSLNIIKVFGRFMQKSKVSGNPIIHDGAIRYYTYYFTAVVAGVVPAFATYMLSQHERVMAQVMVIASMNLLIMGCIVYFASAAKVYLFIVGVL